MNTRWRALIPLLLGIAIWLMPVPAGLTTNAWSYFALCATVIAALITEPIPGPLVGLVGITLAAALHLIAPNPEESIRWALSGFSNGTVWLIFVAFMFGLAYEKTGLGRRIALSLVRLLGRRTLGLGYAIALADLILAPFMPSNTARSGGTIFPIIKNMPALYGSAPGPTSRVIGAYIMWTAFAVQSVTSSMFLTANAANLVAVSLLHETTGIRVSWTGWLTGFLPAGLLLFALVPWLVFVVYPPSIKSSEEVARWAIEERQKIGSVTSRELLLAAIVALALALWIFADERLSPATVALIAFCLMFVSGLITWSDILKHEEAWKVLIWFGTLITLADGLNKVGFLGWFANQIACACAALPVFFTLVLFIALFFISHYMFASLTAHATSLYSVFLLAGTAMPGMPTRPFALALCYTLGLMGVLTPYATGPAPLYFGSGYIAKKDFWFLGSLFAGIFLLILIIVEVPYLLLTVK